VAPRELRFVQVDVFTERVLAGNPLAVVFEGAGLSDVEMQAIAREMNCSETNFLLPPTRPDCAARVRIFTPARELPFAGHPTIGTAWVLATEQLLPPNTHRFNLEEGIGPVEVTLEGEPAQPELPLDAPRGGAVRAGADEAGRLRGRQRGARDRGPAAGGLTPCTSPSTSRSPTPRGATR